MKHLRMQLLPYLCYRRQSMLVIIGALFKAGGTVRTPTTCRLYSARTSRLGMVGASFCSILRHGLHAQYSGGSVPRGSPAALPLDTLRRLPRTTAPLVGQGLCNPILLAILACILLLREIAATTARMSSWTFAMDEQYFTWLQP